ARRRAQFREHRRSTRKPQRRTGVIMARILIIAYTAYARDGRVKRQAEALTSRGDQVDAICLADGDVADTRGVNVIGLLLPRYRGASKIDYLRSYINFFSQAAALAIRRSLKERYDVVIAWTNRRPDADAPGAAERAARGSSACCARSACRTPAAIRRAAAQAGGDCQL